MFEIDHADIKHTAATKLAFSLQSKEYKMVPKRYQPSLYNRNMQGCQPLKFISTEFDNFVYKMADSGATKISKDGSYTVACR